MWALEQGFHQTDIAHILTMPHCGFCFPIVHGRVAMRVFTQVSCSDDASAVRAHVGATDTLYSTELVLSGVLRQDRDFATYILT